MKIQKIIANDKLYEIKRVIQKTQFTDEKLLLKIIKFNNYDALIQNEENYFMCNEISNATFTEYPSEDIKKIDN